MEEFKCKSCGDVLVIDRKEHTGFCESCGSKFPIPRDTSDEITKLYNKADRLRREEKDYDKARKVYEEILDHDNNEPEANWGIILCKYGIQYVKDPVTGIPKPTMNRMQAASVLNDPYYKRTIINAGEQERALYENDAKIIDNYQKKFNEIIATEKPYDVFISYKDKVDGSEQKTPDHEVAKELYEDLMDRGLHVFFSDRSLRGKAVGEYEPYIYAALESAHIMIVVGSRSEYFNSEWVRNEWSRYLDKIQRGADKKLVPVYFDCGLNDVPADLTRKNQAYDYRKATAIGGLLETIERECKRKKDAQQMERVTGGSVPQTFGDEHNTAKQRIFTSLSSGDMVTARSLAEQVLAKEPTYARGYLAYLMAERDCMTQEQLGKGCVPLKNSRYYQNLVRFADDDLMTEIHEYEKRIAENIAKEKKKKMIKTAVIIGAVAAAVLIGLIYFKIVRPAQSYSNAKALLEAGDYQEAYALLSKLGKEDEVLQSKYDRAKESLKAGEYSEAYALLGELGDYKDAADLHDQSRYDRAKEAAAKGDYAAAIALYEELGDYQDSAERILKIKRTYLEEALAAGEYTMAYRLYKELGEDEQAEALAEEYDWVKIGTATPGDTVFFGNYEQDNDSSNGKEPVEWIVLYTQEDKVLLVTKAYIDKMPFSDATGTTNWEISSLRRWMNETMYDDLFNDEEKSRVLLSTLVSRTSADQGPSAHNGNDTEDHVFLLSYDEYYMYQAYLPASDRTTYALLKAGNGNVDLENSYWLRTMYYSDSPYYVSNTNGDSPKSITTWGASCPAGIRPAIWFSTKAVEAASDSTD